MTTKNIPIAYMAIISLFGATGLVFATLNSEAQPELQMASASTALQTQKEVQIEAQAAYVYDMAEGKVLYEKSGTVQLPLASLTKVAVATLARQFLDMNESITLTQADLNTEGDSGFKDGETWNTEDLLEFTLMTSSNDGATALGRKLEEATDVDVVTLLNIQAETLELNQTYFTNPTGLDNSELYSGSYGSAKDVTQLLSYAYKTSPEIFFSTSQQTQIFKNSSGEIYEAKNTNQAIGELPGLVFGKTGFTDLAGGNLGVVVETEPGHAYIIVVLGSSVDGRFADIVKLYKTVLWN
ncbi:hypothetical protein COB52_01835 [Candidatus Kaiserbacteria bacterium]|nr:MAG: hypothetical protein COB52_01835 [Candidatus Kaiserbacteria bacterium]